MTELQEDVHEAMLRIQARPRGCKLDEIVAEVPGIETRSQAAHYANQLVADGRAIKQPGAAGLRALTEKEQDALIAASATLREDTIPWEQAKETLEGEWTDA